MQPSFPVAYLSPYTIGTPGPFFSNLELSSRQMGEAPSWFLCGFSLPNKGRESNCEGTPELF